MKTDFSEQELRERLLDLLYGLVDADEAEELRRLIATDADAARLFDEARETSDLLARAARVEIAENAPSEETAKNVVVDREAFESVSPFAFDAAVDALGKNAIRVVSADFDVLGESRDAGEARVSSSAPISTDAPKNALAKSRSRGGKKRKNVRKRDADEGASPVLLERGDDGETARGRASVGRRPRRGVPFAGTRRAARRAAKSFGRLSLFQRLNVALAALGLAMLIGFVAQETRLRVRFQNDFRIRLAAPSVLARGVSQSIFATTTAPNGNPRRIPLRFCFFDAKSGAFLLAHTESGDASGVARFDVPDSTEFPDRVRLTISAGERGTESAETIETVLPVVDAPSPPQDARFDAFAPSAALFPRVDADLASVRAKRGLGDALARSASHSLKKAPEVAPEGSESTRDDAAGTTVDFANASDAGEIGVDSPDGVPRDESPEERDVWNAPERFGVPENDVPENDVPENPENIGAEKIADLKASVSTNGALSVRFFPEGGALTAELENRVWFSCVDASGNPVAARFALRNRAETADASQNPASDLLFAETSENGVGSFVWTPRGDADYFLERVSAEAVDDSKDAELANGVETPERAAFSETFALPSVEGGRVAFAAFSKVVDVGAPLCLDVATRDKIPLAATVAKNGVVVAQRVWIAEGGRSRVALQVPGDVDGFLTVSLYLCERTPIEKIGATAFYRKSSGAAERDVASDSDSAVPPAFDAEIRRDDAGSPIELAVQTFVDPNDVRPRSPSVAFAQNSASVDVASLAARKARIEVFWAPSRAAARAVLPVEERLSAAIASDAEKAEILGTLDLAETVAPPIVFDNLLGMKKRVLEKLNDFWRVEARSAEIVLRFGLFGCASLAALAIFFVVFRALPLWRGVLIVASCGAVSIFFYLERQTIDFSSALSKSIAFSVAEEEKESVDAALFADRLRSVVPNPALDEAFCARPNRSANSVSNPLWAPISNGSALRLAVVREVPDGASIVLRPRSFLRPDEENSGVLLVKIVKSGGDVEFRENAPRESGDFWTILELAPAIDGAKTSFEPSGAPREAASNADDSRAFSYARVP